jgi:phosphotransferase system enzyme I (PtsI)
MKNKVFRGIPVSPSIAIGKAFIYSAKDITFKKEKKIKSVDEEICKFEKARRKSFKQLRKLKAELKKLPSKEPVRLIDVQILFLQDPLFLNSVEKRIRNNKESAVDSIKNFLESLERDFQDIPNSYISERFLDVKDVGDRILINLGEEKIELDLKGHDNIIVASRLSPTETAQISIDKVSGIVTERGGKTSHIAIIAEALNIPAVVGVNGLLNGIEADDEIIVDGISGIVVTHPDEDTKRTFEKKEKEAEKIKQEFLKNKDLPATTIDGYSIDISANIELPMELNYISKYGAKGVGLLRTEFLYLTSETIPDEKDQYNFYTEIAKICSPDYVIIRTLDLGGDKIFKIKEEVNPFLGWRGVRFSLSNNEIFRTQIRAILRASSFGNIRLLIPMISQVEEMIKVRNIVRETMEELRKEGKSFDENIEIGAMVEVPSVCLLADQFAKVVDFFSIGTNDLTQYVLAVDRGNQKISELYDHLDPSVIKLTKMAVEQAHHNNKWVGVCGGISADIVAVPLLVGLEVDELSLPPSFIPQIKNIIRGLSLKESKELLIEAEKKKSATEVREFLKTELLEKFPALKNIILEVQK